MLKLYIFCVIIISVIISFDFSTSDNPNCGLQSNTNCTTCLNVGGCAYCKDIKKCFPTPINPADAPCKLADLQIQTCFADSQTLAIILGSVGGVVLILIIVFVCCICRKCKQCSLRKLQKSQNVNERRLEERRAAAEVRSAERNEKHEQIRIKYGLPGSKDSTVGYRPMS